MNQKYRQTAGSEMGRQDAIALLTQDHNMVKELFEEFEALKADEDTEDEKLDLVQQICTDLSIHAQIEEEIFYPAAVETIGQLDIMDEAIVEHSKAKAQIELLVIMAPEEDFYDAEVKVLKDMVEHHVQEEEGKMFPKLKKSSLDLVVLGERMSQRKQELQMDLEMGMIGASIRHEQPGIKPSHRGPMR